MVLWVFGYGSLIWKTGFNYDERIIGYVKGYRRVFYQGSTDHRGTRENPGRTVTLDKDDGAITWGAAYRVSDQDDARAVLTYLNFRERAYDVRAYLPMFTVDSGDVPALPGVLVYIATSDTSQNECYLGPACIADMACQIATSIGPSGPNYEYLFRLEESLSEIRACTGVHCVDEDLIKLANEVRNLLGLNGGLGALSPGVGVLSKGKDMGMGHYLNKHHLSGVLVKQ